jgi:hypothetical protein
MGGEGGFLLDRPWFDQETDVLLLDEYVVELDSYKRIVEDGKITDTELLEQTLRVVTLLRQLEEALSPEAKALATEAFGEMAVLNTLQALRLQAASALP